MAETIYTIGTDPSRNYHTIQAWKAAFDSYVFGASEVIVGELYNDDGKPFVIGAGEEVLFDNANTGVAKHRTLRPAPGQEFIPHENKGVKVLMLGDGNDPATRFSIHVRAEKGLLIEGGIGFFMRFDETLGLPSSMLAGQLGKWVGIRISGETCRLGELYIEYVPIGIELAIEQVGQWKGQQIYGVECDDLTVPATYIPNNVRLENLVIVGHRGKKGEGLNVEAMTRGISVASTGPMGVVDVDHCTVVNCDYHYEDPDTVVFNGIGIQWRKDPTVGSGADVNINANVVINAGGCFFPFLFDAGLAKVVGNISNDGTTLFESGGVKLPKPSLKAAFVNAEARDFRPRFGSPLLGFVQAGISTFISSVTEDYLGIVHAGVVRTAGAFSAAASAITQVPAVVETEIGLGRKFEHPWQWLRGSEGSLVTANERRVGLLLEQTVPYEFDNELIDDSERIYSFGGWGIGTGVQSGYPIASTVKPPWGFGRMYTLQSQDPASQAGINADAGFMAANGSWNCWTMLLAEGNSVDFRIDFLNFTDNTRARVDYAWQTYTSQIVAYPTHEKVSYRASGKNTGAQYLDIYIPKTKMPASGKRPVLVVFQISGMIVSIRPGIIAPGVDHYGRSRFLEAGWVVVDVQLSVCRNIQYIGGVPVIQPFVDGTNPNGGGMFIRHTDSNFSIEGKGYDFAFSDAVMAIQWLKWKAAEYGLDKDFFVTAGTSAGAQCALYVAHMPDFAIPASKIPQCRESSRVRSFVGIRSQMAYKQRIQTAAGGTPFENQCVDPWHRKASDPTQPCGDVNLANATEVQESSPYWWIVNHIGVNNGLVGFWDSSDELPEGTAPLTTLGAIDYTINGSGVPNMTATPTTGYRDGHAAWAHVIYRQIVNQQYTDPTKVLMVAYGNWTAGGISPDEVVTDEFAAWERAYNFILSKIAYGTIVSLKKPGQTAASITNGGVVESYARFLGLNDDLVPIWAFQVNWSSGVNDVTSDVRQAQLIVPGNGVGGVSKNIHVGFVRVVSRATSVQFGWCAPEKKIHLTSIPVNVDASRRRELRARKGHYFQLYSGVGPELAVDYGGQGFANYEDFFRLVGIRVRNNHTVDVERSALSLFGERQHVDACTLSLTAGGSSSSATNPTCLAMNKLAKDFLVTSCLLQGGGGGAGAKYGVFAAGLGGNVLHCVGSRITGALGTSTAFRQDLVSGKTRFTACVSIDSELGFSMPTQMQSHNASSDASADGPGAIKNIVPADEFVSPTSGDVRLLPTSQLLNVGPNTVLLAPTDYRGEIRYAPTDIGAYEGFKSTQEVWKPELRTTNRLTRLWHVIRWDGRAFFFTESNEPLQFRGQTYTPVRGLSGSASTADLGFREGSAELYGVIASEDITAEDLRAGKFFGAQVIEYTIDWLYPFYAPILVRRWQLKRPRFTQEWWRADVVGINERLQRNIGSSTQVGCKWIFGDPVTCAFDLTARTYDGVTVASVIDPRRVFRVEHAGIADEPDGAFAFGELIWMNGANAGVPGIYVKSYVQGKNEVEVQVRLPFDVAVGDSMRLKIGCKHIRSACIVYDNLPNYGGEPDTPGTDDALSTPTQ